MKFREHVSQLELGWERVMEALILLNHQPHLIEHYHQLPIHFQSSVISSFLIMTLAFQCVRLGLLLNVLEIAFGDEGEVPQEKRKVGENGWDGDELAPLVLYPLPFFLRLFQRSLFQCFSASQVKVREAAAANAEVLFTDIH